MYCNGSFSVSDAVAVKVTAAPATCGLARSEARLVTAGGLFGGALMTKSIALELSPSGLCLLSFARTSMLCDPISVAAVVHVQLGLSAQLVFGWPSRRNMYCNGSFSVSDAVAVKVTAAPATCGLARSEARLVTAGGLFGGALMTKSIALELSPSGLCLLSFARTSMLCDPISVAAVVHVQLGLSAQLVLGWPSRRNMYCNGSFSVSDAVAVKVTAAPATCGLARSEARLVTAGGLFGGALMTKSIALELSPSGLCLLSFARTSMLCDPISVAAVVHVQLGIICPAGLWLAVQEEHVLQRIVLGVRCGCGKSYCGSCHLRAGQV